MLNILAVGAGGFLGSTLRYLISLISLDESGAYVYCIFVCDIKRASWYCSYICSGISGTQINSKLTR